MKRFTMEWHTLKNGSEYREGTMTVEAKTQTEARSKVRQNVASKIKGVHSAAVVVTPKKW